MNFRDVIQGGRKPGTYRLQGEVKLDELARIAGETGFRFFRIAGENCLSRGAFFREAASAMAFPTGFGHNWDGFYDYLTDLEWSPAKGYVVLFDGYDRMMNHDAVAVQLAVSVFQDACESWADCNVPMYVFFRGDADLESLEPG